MPLEPRIHVSASFALPFKVVAWIYQHARPLRKSLKPLDRLLAPYSTSPEIRPVPQIPDICCWPVGSVILPSEIHVKGWQRICERQASFLPGGRLGGTTATQKKQEQEGDRVCSPSARKHGLLSLKT